MHPSPRTTPLLDHLAETVVIAAWLAVPLFALLAAGAIAPPLHAAAIAALLTLALRCWRTTQRGQPLHQTHDRLATYLETPAHRMVVLRHRRHHPRHGNPLANKLVDRNEMPRLTLR